MEKRWAEKYGIDRHGNPLEIKFTGVDAGELAHFGGLDLQVNVVKYLIGDTLAPLDFAEKNGDFLIGDKVTALFLNEIGEFYRHCHSNSEAWEGSTNLEIIQYFLNEQLSIKAISNEIEKDNKLIKEAEERENLAFSMDLDDIE